MSKKIFIFWGVVLATAVFSIILGACMVDNVRTGEKKKYSAAIIDNWDVSSSDIQDEDGMYAVTYSNTLPDIKDGGEVLTFYAYHGDVYAYVNGQLLYSLVFDKSDVGFPVVPGNSWNCIYIPQQYKGSRLEIVMKSKYDACLSYMPEFYIGDRLNIVRNEVQNSMLSLLLCAVIFVVGVVVIIYSVFITRNNYENYGMLYLGVFAILMSVWFLVNMPVFNMITDMSALSTNLSYLILGSVVVPITLFEKRIMAARYNKACDILCITAICEQFICIVLQLFGIRDLKETLICTHIVFAAAIGGLIIMLVLNLRLVGFKNLSVMNKINILFGMVLSIGVGCDMIRYYVDAVGGRNYEFTKLAFLVYIIAVSYFSVRETIQLMKMGRDDKKYEKMAHMDGLTGVYNRMACNEDMRTLNLSKESYMVFMFDLNNLKQCNDTMGHNYGDLYIKNCAKYIKEAFSNVGKCYRIGGDEFCVIGSAVSEETAKACYAVLEDRIAACNRDNPKMNMSIAYGHTVFDSRQDEDLRDTRERADKIMYMHKVAMKAGVL